MSARIDLSGQTFGRLTVTNQAGSNKWQESLWACRCECGNATVVASNALRRGNTQSCGCLQKARAAATQHKHGLLRRSGPSNHHEYISWVAMLRRCYDERHRAYRYYGGRGITVCDEWKNDFPQFLRDMGPRPPGWTLDRIDNDIGYQPSNCRWAPWSVQAKNKRHPPKPL